MGRLISLTNRTLFILGTMVFFSSLSSVHGDVNRWTPREPEGGLVKSLLILPSPSGTVFAGTPRGVFRSLDGGQTWSTCAHPGLTYVNGVVAVHQEPTAIFAATTNHGIFKSTDGGVSWTYSGLGEVNVFDLKAAGPAPQILYAATINGVYRSDDAGMSWSRMGTGSPSPLVVHQISASPHTSDIVYATERRGCYRTTDGGRTWTRLWHFSIIEEDINCIAMHPDDGYTVFVGTNNGFYRSLDGGETWAPAQHGLPFSTIKNISVAPWPTTTIFCSIWGGGICRSVDNGLHWDFIDDENLKDNAASMAFDPNDEAVIYAGTSRGVCISRDGGQSWMEYRAGLEGLSCKKILRVENQGEEKLYLSIANGELIRSGSGEEWNPSVSTFHTNSLDCLAICPHQPDILMAGDTARFVMKSLDAGATWTGANSGLAWDPILQLVYLPENEDTLYAVTNRFIYKTDSHGAEWQKANLGFSVDEYWVSMAVDPHDGQHLLAIRLPEIAESFDGGVSWAVRYSTLQGNSFDIHFDPTAAEIIVLRDRYDDTAFKSTDHGLTWTSQTWTACWLVMDPHQAGVYYIGQNEPEARYMRSDDHGETWQPVLGDLVGLAGLGDLYIHPHQEGTCFYVKNLLYRSLDGGSHWTEIGAPHVKNVKKLVFDPARPSILYALTESGTFRSADNGDQWGLLDDFPVIPVSTIHADPSNPEQLFVGTNGGGIFRSEDGGDSWLPVNNWGQGRDTLYTYYDVRDFAMDPDNPATLVAANAGGYTISYNGGESWEIIYRHYAEFRDVAISYTQPKRFIFSTGLGNICSDELYFPSDNWMPLHGGAFPSGGYTRSIEPARNGTSYALIQDETLYYRIYRWTSAVAGWEPAYAGTEGCYLYCLHNHPYQSEVLYCGGAGGVFLTENGGQWWREISYGLEDLTVYDLAVSTVHPDLIYAATSSGFFELQLGNGDLNLDDVADSLDLRLLAGYFAGNGPLPVTDNHADHSVDGRLDATDLVWQLRKTGSASAR